MGGMPVPPGGVPPGAVPPGGPPPGGPAPQPHQMPHPQMGGGVMPMPMVKLSRHSSLSEKSCVGQVLPMLYFMYVQTLMDFWFRLPSMELVILVPINTPASVSF